MTNEEAVRKLEYSKTAYQMLIDEKVDSGKLVGKDVKGEWKADTPLDEAYKSMIEALEMGIKAIKALKQEPCDNAVSRQDVLDLAKKGVLVSNGNYESVCKAINELPSVNPQPCEDAIDRAEAIKIASGYCHPANIANELAKLPSVNPQPCEDAISRENAIIRISWDFPTLEISKVKESLDKLPSVTPQPKTGHWITKDGKEQGYDIAGMKTWYIQIMCSECGFIKTAIEGHTGHYKYCPNCGCRMVEPQERSCEE